MIGKDAKAVVLFDVEYFRIACARWSVAGVPSSQALIESLVGGAESIGVDVRDVGRWRCYAYDASYRSDALVEVNPVEVLERLKVHQALRDGGFSVRLGEYVLKRSPYGSGARKVVQKGVDSLLVVDAMREHLLCGAKVFFLVAGDADFVPLVEELLSQRKVVYVVHGGIRSVNARLRFAASGSFELVLPGGVVSVRPVAEVVPVV